MTTLYVARDKSGELYLYNRKPERFEKVWKGNPEQMIPLDKTLFLNLTWSDEPLEVELFSPKMIQKIKQTEYNRGYDFGCTVGINVYDA